MVRSVNHCGDAATSAASIVMAAAPILLVIAVIAELLILPASQWQSKLVGNNSLVCLTTIPLLSLPLLAATLLAQNRGAPTSRSAAGAAAGLIAGGLAAALYATQCTDGSPLFVAAPPASLVTDPGFPLPSLGQWATR